MEQDSSQRKQAITTGYLIAAAFGILILQWALTTYSTIETIPYSQFEQLVSQGKVSEVAVGQDTIQGKLKEKLPDGKQAFVTARVDPAIAEKLQEKGVTVTGVPSGGLFQTILSWIVPAFLFYLVWVFLFRRIAERQGFGGLMSIGKSRAKVYVEKDTKTTFADVAGVEEAKFELQEVVSFLKDPKSYGRLGAHVPKGILLVGPPGTGKTMLAQRLHRVLGARRVVLASGREQRAERQSVGPDQADPKLARQAHHGVHAARTPVCSSSSSTRSPSHAKPFVSAASTSPGRTIST